MTVHRLSLHLAVAVAAMLVSCDGRHSGINGDLTLEYYAPLHCAGYSVDADSVTALLRAMAMSDRGSLAADRNTRSYYLSGGVPLWVSYAGVDSRVDSVIHYIMYAREGGIREDVFAEEQIKADAARLRELRFDSANSITRVVARLEYNLTRSYQRCAQIQHYGLVNPSTLYNHLELKDPSTSPDDFLRLYDVPVLRPDSSFFARARAAVVTDSVGSFLSSLQPRGELYALLVERLAATTDSGEREKLICNIERCRWCHDNAPSMHERYVEVNMPGFTLYGVSPDSVVQMKIICGAVKTKSPILTSAISRIDINPKWIVPKSIAKGYVGDTAYLQRNNMYVYDKERGRLPVGQGSYDRVMSGDQHIIQESGDDNSLGRIVFRFANNYSIYLHYTSSPYLFERSVRAMSHGCIRLERPIDLARFILADRDDDIVDRIDYSVTVDLSADAPEPPDGKRMVNSVAVEPAMPLFISYYTVYAPPGGRLSHYADVYGYDAPLLDKLRPYIR